MDNSLIVNILKSLSKEEIKDFGRFAGSPYFVNRKKVYELFEILKDFYPDFPQEAMEKGDIYKKLFPGAEYDDVVLRKAASYLHKALKEYLAYRNFKNNEFLYDNCLLEEAYKRGLDKLALSSVNSMEKLLNENSMQSEEAYYNRYKLEEQKHILSSGKNSERDWQKTFDSYCTYFLFNLLRHYSVMSNDMKFYKIEYRLHFRDEVLSMLEGSMFLKVPSIAIYFYTIKLFYSPENEDYFYKLKELLFKNGGELDKVAEEGIYIYLQNYCYRRSDAGEARFLKERFDILKKMIGKKLCLRQGYMIKDFFNSMVIVSLELGEVSYAENFIKKYRSFLQPAQDSSILNFNYACLEFYKKNYESALEYLSKVEYDDFYDKVIVRSMNLMIYYEAGMIEQGLSLIDSFNHFLSSNKDVSPYVKKRTKNFINLVNRLFKLKEANTKTDPVKLKKDIYESDMLMRRMWLIEKISELETIKEK